MVVLDCDGLRQHVQKLNDLLITERVNNATERNCRVQFGKELDVAKKQLASKKDLHDKCMEREKETRKELEKLQKHIESLNVTKIATREHELTLVRTLQKAVSERNVRHTEVHKIHVLLSTTPVREKGDSNLAKSWMAPRNYQTGLKDKCINTEKETRAELEELKKHTEILSANKTATQVRDGIMQNQNEVLQKKL